MKWYRTLIARKYDGSANRKGGRPKVSKEIIDLVLKLKRQNPRWGYLKIRDQIVYLGYRIGKTTVKQILLDHGINPNPDRRKSATWEEFIRSHLDVLAAVDFFSVELLTPKGLVRCMVLFAIEVASRKVQVLGIKPVPDGEWMKQIARNITDCEEGFLKGKRYLVHDRDPLFTKAFQDIVKSAGIVPIQTCVCAPNMNEYYSNCTSLVA